MKTNLERWANGMGKYIYLICSVRNGTSSEAYAYVIEQERIGNRVHFPPIDVNQDDPTGMGICIHHKKAMLDCDEVHVFWSPDSFGSHFDLGMAFALNKPIKYVGTLLEDKPGKSYYKVILELHRAYFNTNSRQ